MGLIIIPNYLIALNNNHKQDIPFLLDTQFCISCRFLFSVWTWTVNVQLTLKEFVEIP